MHYTDIDEGCTEKSMSKSPKNGHVGRAWHWPGELFFDICLPFRDDLFPAGKKADTSIHSNMYLFLTNSIQKFSTTIIRYKQHLQENPLLPCTSPAPPQITIIWSERHGNSCMNLVEIQTEQWHARQQTVGKPFDDAFAVLSYMELLVWAIVLSFPDDGLPVCSNLLTPAEEFQIQSSIGSYCHCLHIWNAVTGVALGSALTGRWSHSMCIPEALVESDLRSTGWITWFKLKVQHWCTDSSTCN